MTRVEDVKTASLDTLERLYRDTPNAPVPVKRYRGQALCRVNTPFAGSATAAVVLIPFERMPFGVDFIRRTWFFFHPRIHLGRFRVESGRSRWRETHTQQLIYDVSRLPFRGILYDEVKPLSDRLCLGLGGLNQGLGQGDLFYFLLEADDG